jgi:hypothetical protein
MRRHSPGIGPQGTITGASPPASAGGHLDQIREDSLGQSKIISAGEIRPLAGKTQIGALCRPTRIGQPLSVVNDDSARRIEDFVSA